MRRKGPDGLDTVPYAEDGHGVGELRHHGRRRRQKGLREIMGRGYRSHSGQQFLPHTAAPVLLRVGGGADPLHLAVPVDDGRGDDLDVAEPVEDAVEPHPHDRVEGRALPRGPAPGPLEPVPVLGVHGVHPRGAGVGVPELLGDAASRQQGDLAAGRHHPHRLRHGAHERLVPPEETLLVHGRALRCRDQGIIATHTPMIPRFGDPGTPVRHRERPVRCCVPVGERFSPG